VKDNWNDRDVYVPAAGLVAGCYAFTDTNFAPWYAPAGARRGNVSVVEIATDWTSADLDILYDAKCNFAKLSSKYGVTVEGQRTLYGVSSAMNRVNVARLIIHIRNSLMSFLEDFIYEFNSDLTRTLITSGASAFLTNIQANQGLYDFRVICDATNNTPQIIDTNQLVLDCYLKPVKVAEFLKLRAIVASTGVKFDDLIALVNA
jgi:phage tail sheath protein FI